MTPPPAALLLLAALLGPACAKQVCYGDLGCFDNTGVWSGRGLPQAPEDLAARFLLFTRRAPTETELLFNKTSLLHGSDFDAARARTIVLVHGFADSCNQPWPAALREALLAAEDANLLCVDWPFGSAQYARARDNARLLGALGERMLRWLGDAAGLRTDQLYLVGHDVGAHAAAYISARLEGVPRLTGLDPAALDFDGADSQVRIDAADARLVDVVVSDAAGSDALGLGMSDDGGRVNFRPNGGAHQPGCRDNISSFIHHLTGLRTLDISREDWLKAACSHFRSVQLFTESVSSGCGFVAVPCASWEALVSGSCPSRCQSGKCQRLGPAAADHAANGTFYLFTAPAAPFCQAFHTIEVSVGSGQPETYGTLTISLPADPHAPLVTVHDGRFDHYDVLRASLAAADPADGELLVDATYKRKSSVFHSYSRTLQVGQLSVAVLDGDMRLRTFRAAGEVLETGDTTTLTLQD